MFAAWAHWPVLKQHDQRSLRPPTPRKQTGSFRRKLGDFGTCTRGRARYKTIAIRPRRLGSNGFAGGCWPSQAGLSVLSFCQNASCHFVIPRRRRAVRVSALTEACKESTVSPFLRKFAKLPPLNLQDPPYLAFFLTLSGLRSRRVIPVLQRVLISLRCAGRFPAVHPTAAVFHRCRSARLSSALRSSPAARAQMHREFALHGVEHLSRGSVWGWISPEP